MMKIMFLMTGLLLSAWGLSAQGDSPVVVISAQGKVRYVSESGAVTEPVVAGAVLKKSGSLEVPAGADVLLQCDGQFQRLQGKGAQPLSSVFTDRRGLTSLNFDSDFSKFIQTAVSLSASKTGVDGWGDAKKTGDGWGDAKKTGDGWGDAKKTGDGWGDAKGTGDGWGDAKKTGDGWGDAKGTGDGWGDAKGTGDGWGGHGAKIILILPGGNLRPGIVNFSWSRPADAATFKLEIMDADAKVVYTATVKDTFAPVNLLKLNLIPEENYAWRVSVPGGGNVVSQPGEFTVLSQQQYVAAAKKVASSKIYKSAAPPLKRIMEAVALEKAGWYYDADRLYSDVLKANPSDQMIRLLYAAFWMRGGLEPKAKAVISG